MPEARPSGFWDMVDGVLVINLDSRPERWERFRALASGVIPATKLSRLAATAGVQLPGYGERPWFRGRKRDRTWAGRAGCALSHRAAIAHARQRGWQTLLILEDDIETSPALAGVLAALPKILAAEHWDVCYLGYTDPVPPYRAVAQLPDDHVLFQVYGCSTTHAYLLRDTTFDWLLANLPLPADVWSWISVHRAIDRWYYRNLARRFRVLAVSPTLINQQRGFSDITQRLHDKVHDTRVPDRHRGPLGYTVQAAWRWLGFRLAEPRDWLRGRIKRARGF